MNATEYMRALVKPNRLFHAKEWDGTPEDDWNARIVIYYEPFSDVVYWRNPKSESSQFCTLKSFAARVSGVGYIDLPAPAPIPEPVDDGLLRGDEYTAECVFAALKRLGTLPAIVTEAGELLAVRLRQARMAERARGNS